MCCTEMSTDWWRTQVGAEELRERMGLGRVLTGQRRITVYLGRVVQACEYTWRLGVKFLTYFFSLKPHSNPASYI